MSNDLDISGKTISRGNGESTVSAPPAEAVETILDLLEEYDGYFDLPLEQALELFNMDVSDGVRYAGHPYQERLSHIRNNESTRQKDVYADKFSSDYRQSEHVIRGRKDDLMAEHDVVESEVSVGVLDDPDYDEDSYLAEWRPEGNIQWVPVEWAENVGKDECYNGLSILKEKVNHEDFGDDIEDRFGEGASITVGKASTNSDRSFDDVFERYRYVKFSV